MVKWQTTIIYIIFQISVTARFLDCFFGILKTECVSKTREKALLDGFKQISVRWLLQKWRFNEYFSWNSQQPPPKFSKVGEFWTKNAFFIMRQNLIEWRLVNDRPLYIFFSSFCHNTVLGLFSSRNLNTKWVSKTGEKTLSDGFKQISVRWMGTVWSLIKCPFNIFYNLVWTLWWKLHRFCS